MSYCREHGGFSLATLRLFIEKEDVDNATFYSVLFGLKILCAETFPGFNLEDYDDLEFVPRPYLEHWGIYQEIDNILDPLEKNMICNGLFEMASLLRDGKSFSHSEVRNAAILGLAYVTGARPVQLARLAVKDVRIDTRNQESGLIRYSVFLPYAKQRRVTTERLFLAIPSEIGELIMNYTVRYKKNPEDKLFDFSVSAPHYVSQAINQAILNFCPPEYQAAVACGEAALPTITPTDLRHNVGHSLAMQGASAEEIAHVLGHTSLAVAKYYIMATPALALIRAKALGANPVWQNMVAMMLTGELVDSAHWKGHPVVGLVGDELHNKIGGCSRNSSTCPFSEVRSCYGCLYYRPFTDGEHQALLECVKKEVDELIAISDSVGNSRNPLILIHETTQFEIESVIARCRFHKEQVKSNEKSL
ncbi:TPA: site-specific integrase [Escherichia coli]|nr:tyrosine-type recombinase/integrase [Escherichia coli]EFL9396932.1 site-specific integrase [Escherichia coli]EGI1115841.1 site-specific integrase [Escherichia coli]EJC3549885.1 site-specific integrase [Escherichia coli]EJH5707943.1 site-specific integrase [Escherichia coli]